MIEKESSRCDGGGQSIVTFSPHPPGPEVQLVSSSRFVLSCIGSRCDAMRYAIADGFGFRLTGSHTSSNPKGGGGKFRRNVQPPDVP